MSNNLLKMKNRKNWTCITFLILSQTLFAQTAPQQIHLWENGAPGFENKKNEPETAQDWWVRNIHNPTITVFLPPKDFAVFPA